MILELPDQWQFRILILGILDEWMPCIFRQRSTDMKIHVVENKKDMQTFLNIQKTVYLNNQSFRPAGAALVKTLANKKLPYWSGRDYSEDYELFAPIKNLLCNDILIVAEYKGNPIAFLLWFPDFNQLLTSNFEELRCKYPFSRHWRKFRFSNPIDTLRLAEIGIAEDFHKKTVDLALAKAFVETIKDLNFEFCEGGFIFRENTPSINLAKKYLHRFLNVTPEIYRKFAIYEAEI